MEKTAVQLMIEEFTSIKENKCKTLMEQLFFDGVLAIIETKYLELEKKQLIEAYEEGFENNNIDKEEAEQYYTNKFNKQ